MIDSVRSIGVVGAGTMGAGIAQVCVAAGYSVVLHDASESQLERAETRVRTGLERMASKGRLGPVEEVCARLQLSPHLLELTSADWVIEAIVEDAAAKEALHAGLGRLCAPGAILATNTSSISITRLGAASGRPERFVGLHFFNPPPLMALVEVVAGLRTAPETLAAARALAERLGKVPVEAADRPGFIANRILMPFLNEAIRALEEGVGTADAIDQIAKLGFNHPMGPLALADLIGLDVCLAILEVQCRELGAPHHSPCPLLRKYVEAGWLGRKTGRGFYDYQDGDRTG